MRGASFCFLIAIGVAMSTGCGIGHSAGTDFAAVARPTVLRYCNSPSVEEPEAQTIRLERLKAYLSKTLNVKVELYKTAEYGGVIEAMRAKKIDVAAMGPFGYLIASEKAGAEAIIISGTKDGPGVYSGMIAVAKNSPIHSIQELVAHSKELTFSFVDPDSTSGHLVQRVYLQSVGIDPEKDFKKAALTPEFYVCGCRFFVLNRFVGEFCSDVREENRNSVR